MQANRKIPRYRLLLLGLVGALLLAAVVWVPIPAPMPTPTPQAPGSSTTRFPTFFKDFVRSDLRLGQGADRSKSSERASKPPRPGSLLYGLIASLPPNHQGTDPTKREQDLGVLASSVPAGDIPSVVDFLQSRTNLDSGQDLKMRLLRRWAETDPRSAADWVGENSLGSSRQEAINGVAVAWADWSVVDAADWVRQLPEALEREGGLIALAYEAARSEPIEALRLAMELPTSEARDDLIIQAVGQWAANFPDEAAKWGQQIAEPVLRDTVVAGIATAWGDTDPAAAAMLALKSLPPGKRQDDALVGIVQRWTQKEPEHAAAWVLRFPEGRLRDTALEQLVGLWAGQNPQAAGEWVDSFPPSPARDVALGAYVKKLAPQFPELAAVRARDIGDELLRFREMEAVGELWMSQDAKAAREWVSQAGLPDATAVRILGSVPK